MDPVNPGRVHKQARILYLDYKHLVIPNSVNYVDTRRPVNTPHIESYS